MNNLGKVLAEDRGSAAARRPTSAASSGAGAAEPGHDLDEYRRYGTEVNFVPIVLSNGNIRLACGRASASLDSPTA